MRLLQRLILDLYSDELSLCDLPPVLNLDSSGRTHCHINLTMPPINHGHAITVLCTVGVSRFKVCVCVCVRVCVCMSINMFVCLTSPKSASELS